MRSSPILAIAFLIALHASAGAQEGKVIVVDSTSKELKRTAYRLRVPAERVKNAREALSEATTLAKRTLPSGRSFDRLAGFWLTVHKAAARDAISGMVAELRSAARDAKELQGHQQHTSSARNLLLALSHVDLEAAEKWARQWPDPPGPKEKGAKPASSLMEAELRKEVLLGLVQTDPERALELFTKEDPWAADYGTQARLAKHLAGVGKKDESLRIVDSVMSEFAGHEPDPESLNEFANFVQSLPSVAPERWLDAFTLLTRAAAAMPSVPDTPVAVGGSNQAVSMNAVEVAGFNMIRALRGRPELALKALDSVPGLRAKLERTGGIDAALAIPEGSDYGLQDPFNAGNPVTAPLPPIDFRATPVASELYNKVRGKTGDSRFVRDTLAGAAKGPENIQLLIDFIEKARWLDDMDSASIAIDQAQRLLPRVEPAERRTLLFVQLLRLSRWCDGEADPGLLKYGFLLVHELREQEKGQPGPESGRRSYYSADRLEGTLIAELARSDFEAAMRYTRSLSVDALELEALLAIVLVCIRPWM